MFEPAWRRTWKSFREALREGRYQPQGVRRVWITKPGSKEQRPLGIPTVRDRVVQTALMLVLEPILEREFAEQSYGFRPKRGCKDALRRVEELLQRRIYHGGRRRPEKLLRHDSCGPLMELVEERVSDGRVIEAAEGISEPGGDGKGDELDAGGGNTARSGDQPAAVQHLPRPAGPSDGPSRVEMVRYADDFVILCRSKAEAEEALEEVRHGRRKPD